MRDPVTVQQELDAAQADLEDKVGELKEAVNQKLETPRKVISGIKRTVLFTHDHYLAIGAVVGLALTVVILRRLLRTPS